MYKKKIIKQKIEITLFQNCKNQYYLPTHQRSNKLQNTKLLLNVSHISEKIRFTVKNLYIYFCSIIVKSLFDLRLPSRYFNTLY